MSTLRCLSSKIKIPIAPSSLSKRCVSTEFGPLPIVNSNLVEMGVSPSLGINELQMNLINEGRKVSRMGFGASPFPVPQCMQQRLIEHTNKKYYLPVKGLPELQECVANVYSKEHGLNYTADDISVSPGSKENLFILQLAYQADLILPSPAWVSYAPQAKIIGRRIKWIHTAKENGFKVTPEQLEEETLKYPDRPRILILNSPNNPTGMMYNENELKDIADICRKNRILVLSDEIYSPLTFDGLEFNSIAKYYPEGTIILNGLSKWSGAGGYRLGVFIFPSNLRWLQNAMAIIASETFSSASAPIQYAACAVWENYYGDEIQNYLKVSRTILNTLAAKSHEILQQIDGCYVNRSQGAFYTFPDFTNVPGLKQICPNSNIFDKFLLNECGVAGLGGSCFGRDPNELTIKFSFVDFDGRTIFDDLNNMPQDIESPQMDVFIRKHCSNTIEGFEAVRDLMNNLHNVKMK
eukprot:176858_1